MSFNLDSVIAEARLTVGEVVKSDPLEMLVGEQIVTLVVSKLPVSEWREHIALFPPRNGVNYDINIGYNREQATKHFPVTHVHVVDGDDLVEVSQEQWDAIYSLLESPDITNLEVLVWGLHEFAPASRRESVKKASAQKSGRSRKR